jgi:hypothetical protein
MQADFHGSLDNFRALMSYLHSQHGGDEWTLPSGARLVIRERSYSDPTIHASWVVTVPLDVGGPNKRCATIQAFSRDEKSAVVLFQDHRSISPNRNTLGEIHVLDPERAVGPLFDELCQELQRHMHEWAPPPPAPPARGDTTHFSPSLTPPEPSETTTTSGEDGGGPPPAGAQTESPPSIGADATPLMPAFCVVMRLRARSATR